MNNHIDVLVVGAGPTGGGSGRGYRRGADGASWHMGGAVVDWIGWH